MAGTELNDIESRHEGLANEIWDAILANGQQGGILGGSVFKRLIDGQILEASNPSLPSEAIVGFVDQVFIGVSALANQAAKESDCGDYKEQIEAAKTQALKLLSMTLIERLRLANDASEVGGAETVVADIRRIDALRRLAELGDGGGDEANFEEFLSACLDTKMREGVERIIASSKVQDLCREAGVTLTYSGGAIRYLLEGGSGGTYTEFNALHRDMRSQLPRFEGMPAHTAFGKLYAIVGKIGTSNSSGRK